MLDEYEGQPDDPEEAFLFIEEKLWGQMAECHDQDGDIFYLKRDMMHYVTGVLSARETLALQFDLPWDNAPRHAALNTDEFWDFFAAVTQFKQKLKISIPRRYRGDAVEFDEASKQKVRHWLDRVREMIEASDLSPDHKARLVDKLNQFSNELDRTRSRVQVMGGTFLELMSFAGRGLEKSKVLEFIQSITDLVYVSRANNPQLPPRPAPKQIEHKAKTSKPFELKAPDADDIPF
jgi:hypothetical protein